MAPTALALILGWWLVAASGEQKLPRPSLSLHPSQGIEVGDAVTLRCHLPRLDAWVWLYKGGLRTYRKYKDKEQDTAEFFLSPNWEHTGSYRCQYQLYWTAETSELSDPVELVLTDHSFPPPSISLSPAKRVGTGTNVSIQCWNQGYGGSFLLHKDGCSAPIQCQELLGEDKATFTILGVTPADSGTYRCSYRPWAQRFLSSPIGNNVTLEVAPTPAPPGAAGRSHGIPVVAVVGGCSAAFVFILALVAFFLLAARRRRMRRDESPGAPAEKPEDEEFQAASSDSEGLTYMELQAVTPGAQPPNPAVDPQPSVIYAEVAAGRRR
ncbi:leukocyte immunoglobulin-like receptor subfamily B member 1 isoform X2 [Lagopus muta]|uniref:leukocyte immunoglobulin-like receptor subfamily B member 1 isoform X2 n=1 Tax=Lagopus muta TaxID=64668 RepID=UPI00209E8D65|nr:leukocyte immunoglobulin-like receptor subfamily B member 1 isoform X2 [Lagopus muta]